MNASLFDLYSTYLSNTILLPLVGLPSVQFDPLTEANRLNVAPTTVVHSYNCQVRQLNVTEDRTERWMAQRRATEDGSWGYRVDS
jgi:hypothetical protein